MDAIEYLKEVDPWLVFFVVISIVLAGKFIYKTFIEDIIQKYGWETQRMRKHREDHEKIEILMELTKKTAENLEKLQERHSKDEEEFRQNLNNYMEESRKDRKVLHDEMSKFTSNRVSDRQQSLQIQKELKESVNAIIEGQKSRDEQIIALMCGSKELLGNTIDERYEKYINLGGIPQNEVDEFDSIYEAYALLNGNHGRETKYAYVKNHLPVIPVKTELVMRHE